MRLGFFAVLSAEILDMTLLPEIVQDLIELNVEPLSQSLEQMRRWEASLFCTVYIPIGKPEV